ncbi:PREDICTED: protein germ cell-less [Ceratosolen solmsi marchali]|uniref:Protein germ cell-less n=1 Tax=Ceratosolen solmsi marchali TaxID=326594 RepID=A0AAJ7DWZ0_9HYME|nr:PREDICTED: protein germ cell-less [Ceratosolen solmsi marchali]
MGSYVSRVLTASNSAVNSVYRGRKRKCIEEDDLESESRFIDKTMQTPKRRKLLTTAQYIYKTLFQEEKGSDVTVLMLGKAWRLHKVYISQSPYFASMFSGSWREANEKVVSVEITDPNITLDSLTLVLGSFYQDEISLEPKDVISILATATLFQLQGLIDQCTEIMAETTNIKTVVPYYNAAVAYGVPKVKNTCKRWLEVNVVGYGWLYPTFLKEINSDLMAELISSPDLIAMQTEFCIYMMLRIWLFVHIQSKDEIIQIEEFFRSHTWTEPFLDTKEGKEFCAPFKALRKKYLLLNDQDVKLLQNDNIIPEDWLYESYKEQWLHILRIDANKDTGPKNMDELDFSRECFRCARCVDRPGEHVWRWTAFHFGLDLVVNLDLTTLRFKRYNRLDSEHIKANHSKHHIILKVCLISLNEQRQIKYIQDSGQIRLSLHKNEEKQVMCLDKDLSYPLYISVNMQVVTPFSSNEEERNASITVLADS